MLTVAITGASGLVGTELSARLNSVGHAVVPMTRKATGGADHAIIWDPVRGVVNPQQLESVDAVVHLAGENIAAGRWSAARKDRIRTSRVDGTRALVRSLAGLGHRPRTLVCASAIGFYGDRSDEILTESSVAGSGFLADLCSAWESEAMAAAEFNMRVVCLRIGVVLSPKGGALAKMLLPFKLGFGGVIGSGKQFWSWIGLSDLVRTMEFCIENENTRGPVNAVSPQPLTNYDFTKTVGRVLHRPTVFPLPAFVARIVLGEMAEPLLLASVRVVPEQLQAHGFQFGQPDLTSCLEHELK